MGTLLRVTISLVNQEKLARKNNREVKGLGLDAFVCEPGVQSYLVPS